MRVEIGGSGYTECSLKLRSANELAACYHHDLTTDLAGTGGMAGDSSVAGDFATSYDTAATDTLTALGQATGALAGLGRLAAASLENHTRAELASRLTPLVVPTDDVEPTINEQAWYRVRTTPPPTVLGSDLSSLPEWANVILDHVEGFCWPDADVDRLRTAATSWHTTALRTREVARLTNQGADLLWDEHSPEVCSAVGHVTQLGSMCHTLADHMDDIGASCEAYATATETQREAILDLVRDMIRDAIAIQAAGFLLGLVSAGAGNLGAAALNLAKIAEKAPLIRGFVDTVRATALAAAIRLDTAATRTVQLEQRLTRYAQASPKIATLGKFGRSELEMPGFLHLHDAMGGHAVLKHVGMSDEQLLRRYLDQPNLPMSSSFRDIDMAEDTLQDLMLSNEGRVKAWLDGSGNRLRLEGPASGDIGRCVGPDGVVHAPNGVFALLRRDGDLAAGFRVQTVFPTVET